MERLLIWLAALIAGMIACAPIAWGGPASFACRAAIIVPLVWLGVLDRETAQVIVIY